MTQRRVTLLTQGSDTVIIEFQELERHSFRSRYHIITDTKVANYGTIIEQWLNGLDIDDKDLKIDY